MTTKSALRILKEHKPTRRDQIEKLLPIKYISKGSYRTAFKITDTDLIIKIEDAGQTEHTERELTVLATLRTKRHLLKHLPQILYSSMGVVAMPVYKRVEDTDELAEKIYKLTREVSEAGVYAGDLHVHNVMQDKCGNLRIIDMGFFSIREERQ